MQVHLIEKKYPTDGAHGSTRIKYAISFFYPNGEWITITSHAAKKIMRLCDFKLIASGETERYPYRLYSLSYPHGYSPP